MSSNRFGFSPVVIGNIATVKFDTTTDLAAFPAKVVSPLVLSVNSADNWIMDADAGASIVTIPDPAREVEGKTFFFKRNTSTNDVTVKTVSNVTVVANTLLTTDKQYVVITCQNQTNGSTEAWGWVILEAGTSAA